MVIVSEILGNTIPICDHLLSCNHFMFWTHINADQTLRKLWCELQRGNYTYQFEYQRKKENDASWHDIKISFVGNNNWSWQVLNCNNSCLFLFYGMFYNTLQRHDKLTKTRCVNFKLCSDRCVWSTNYE